MADRPDIATLLPPIEAVDTLPPEALPGFVAGLAALQARAASRLVIPTDDAGLDRLVKVGEAAKFLDRSVDWLYKNADRLPFTRRDRRSLRFSYLGIRRYIDGRP
jgi:hypothetical protein